VEALRVLAADDQREGVVEAERVHPDETVLRETSFTRS